MLVPPSSPNVCHRAPDRGVLPAGVRTAAGRATLPGPAGAVTPAIRRARAAGHGRRASGWPVRCGAVRCRGRSGHCGAAPPGRLGVPGRPRTAGTGSKTGTERLGAPPGRPARPGWPGAGACGLRSAAVTSRNRRAGAVMACWQRNRQFTQPPAAARRRRVDMKLATASAAATAAPAVAASTASYDGGGAEEVTDGPGEHQPGDGQDGHQPARGAGITDHVVSLCSFACRAGVAVRRCRPIPESLTRAEKSRPSVDRS